MAEFKRRRSDERREQAVERQEAHEGLTVRERLDKSLRRGGPHTKESQKLMRRLEKSK